MISVYQNQSSIRVVLGEHAVAKEHSKLQPRVYRDATQGLAIETDERIRCALVDLGGEVQPSQHIIVRNPAPISAFYRQMFAPRRQYRDQSRQDNRTFGELRSIPVYVEASMVIAT